jgi:hypothetical protein
LEQVIIRERDKIRKERDKKGEQGGTKRTISDISVEQVTAIISAIQNNAPSATETTHSTQAGNAFGGKAGIKKMRE